MNSKILLLNIVIFLFSCSNQSSTGKNLSTLGFYNDADTIISTLKKEDMSHHEHFMLGLAYKIKKNYKSSIYHFANSCFKSHRTGKLKLYAHPVYSYCNEYHIKSPYYNDAVYEISQLFYLYREHKYVVKFIDLLSKEDTALYRDAVLLKALSLTAEKKYSQAINELMNISDDYPGAHSQSMINIRIASIYEKMNNNIEAKKAYYKVLGHSIKSWQSSISARGLLNLMKDKSLQITPSEKLLVAKSLFYSKKYKKSITILLQLINNDTLSTDAAKFLVKNYTRKKEDGKADEIISKFKKDEDLYFTLIKIKADELWSMNKRYKTIGLYQKIIDKDYKPLLQDTLKRLGTYLEERKQPGHQKYLEKYVSLYNDGTTEKFLWLMGRTRIRHKSYNEAEKYLLASLKKFPRGDYSDQCRFWLYKINIYRGEKDTAHSFARDLAAINPDSSYTWRLLNTISKKLSTESLISSYEEKKEDNINEKLFYHMVLLIKEKSLIKRNDRLKDISTAEKDSHSKLFKSIMGMKLSSKYKSNLKKLKKYFHIGYIGAINRELSHLPDDTDSVKDKYITMAKYGWEYNNAYLSVFSYLELLKLYKIKENISLMPDKAVRLLFPLPYNDCVSMYSKEIGVSEDMIYSIVKAESLFNHSAVSSAGATGLMQLMPSTARGIARRLKIKEYNLKNPCTSIHFGTKYISWLNRQYKGNFDYIVAAYNAGGGNVDKWKKKMKNEDSDYFTEFTPFIETRYYILRTGKFLVQYKILDQN